MKIAPHDTCTLSQAPEPAFTTERGWLTMADDTRLSVTYFKPASADPEEKFPVLLEMLPYRKDDMFYARDYPLGAYFARRGYVVARVDVRGTGSSEGAVPDREYSTQELDDAVEVVEQLAEAPWSTGKVGMYGISWGGFNAIQTAMRKPEALKAILAVDASDDLFHDDVHYIDGCYHLDRYEVSIDNDNGMPSPLDYGLGEAYFRDRFDREPWLFNYLRHQQDGEFWRRESLRFQQPLEVPAYLIGGLLDGYRDSVPRMLETSRAPVKAEIGPWNHDWPNGGKPGPNYEWRQNLVRWWDHWLKDKDTGILDEPRFALFMREGHGPDADLQTTPGHWRYEDWPIPRTRWWTTYPASGGALSETPTEGSERLTYKPGSGTAAGAWWGEPTGDMAPDDPGALVFDSAPMTEATEIAGFPKVHLEAIAGAPLAHFVVRLEDVAPDGSVSLVTGAGLNGAQRHSRLEPEALKPGQRTGLELDLHCTTWTFQPGHRVRVSVTNAQFPMLWPTPYPMETTLCLGEGTRLELPVLPPEERPVPDFPPPEPEEPRPDARSLPGGGWPRRFDVCHDPASGETRWEWDGENHYQIGERTFSSRERIAYRTNDHDPAHSSAEGEAGHHILLENGRELDYRTRLEVGSDEENFHVTYTRRLEEDGELVRERTWEETIPRHFQ